MGKVSGEAEERRSKAKGAQWERSVNSRRQGQAVGKQWNNRRNLSMPVAPTKLLLASSNTPSASTPPKNTCQPADLLGSCVM